MRFSSRLHKAVKACLIITMMIQQVAVPAVGLVANAGCGIRDAEAEENPTTCSGCGCCEIKASEAFCGCCAKSAQDQNASQYVAEKSSKPKHKLQDSTVGKGSKTLNAGGSCCGSGSEPEDEHVRRSGEPEAPVVSKPGPRADAAATVASENTCTCIDEAPLPPINSSSRQTDRDQSVKRASKAVSSFILTLSPPRCERLSQEWTLLPASHSLQRQLCVWLL